MNWRPRAEESEDEFPADEADDDEDELFRAAYEDVTYRDSTDDGVEGEVFEGGESPTDFELVGEAERIVSRLSFLTTVAQLWKLAATASLGASESASESGTGSLCRNGPESAAYKANLSRFPTPEHDDVLAGWLDQAARNHEQLLGLLASVHRHRIPPPRGTQESLVEYDRRRSVKETLLEEIIQTCVETGDAARVIRASMVHPPTVPAGSGGSNWPSRRSPAVLRGDAAGVRGVFPELLRALAEQPLLYVAVGQGGNPQTNRRVARPAVRDPPPAGLSAAAGVVDRDLPAAADRSADGESGIPSGPRAITEFDETFEIGCQGDRAVLGRLVRPCRPMTN